MNHMKSIKMPIYISIKVTQAHDEIICTMHITIIFLIIEKLFVVQTPSTLWSMLKISRSTSSNTSTVITSSLVHLPCTTSSHCSSLAITRSPTQSSFPDHHILYLLTSIPIILETVLWISPPAHNIHQSSSLSILHNVLLCFQ